jgi:hypothetical protein
MASLRTPLLAGIAAIGIGLAGAASAQTAHVMSVPVPGGGYAEIRYVGEVPPQVAFVPAPVAAYDGWVPAGAFFEPSPFAMIGRIAAEMDRRMTAMFRDAEAMAVRAHTGQPIEVAFGSLPPGSQSYSFVSTISGNGVCTQSVRIISEGSGAPRVERHSSGNCGPAAPAPGRSAVRPVAPVPAVPAKRPDLILTQNSGAQPYAGVIRQVASADR